MLRAIHVKTGKPVEIGDEIVDFRGNKAILVSLDRVNEMRYGGRRSGKITVELVDQKRSDRVFDITGSVYDKVYDIIVIEIDWENLPGEAV